MMSPLAILLVVAGGVAVLLAGLATHSTEELVANRVDLIVHLPAGRTQAHPARVLTWWERALAAVRAFFAFRMRRSWGISAGPLQLIAAALIGALIGWLLGRIVLHVSPHVATIGAVIGFFALPRAMLIRQQRRADALFGELLPDGIDMIVRIVRAGLPVAAAIRTVGQEGNPPLSAMFANIANQHDIGMPLDQALAQTSEVVGNPDFRFFAVAVALQQTTGGNLAMTLETLSQIIRRRRAVRLKARATSAEVRISAVILGAIPFFVAAALSVVAPNYLQPLLTDWRGNVILGMAVLCLVLAALMMRAIIRRGLRM